MLKWRGPGEVGNNAMRIQQATNEQTHLNEKEWHKWHRKTRRNGFQQQEYHHDYQRDCLVLGKTTLALSAPDVLLIDADGNGQCKPDTQKEQPPSAKRMRNA